MFPRRSFYERLRNRDPKIYGNLEHVFYAYQINQKQLPDIKDMYNVYDSDADSTNKDNTEAKKTTYHDKTRAKKRPVDDGFDYFIINTMVGVGSKGKQKIRRVHIRFTIWPITNDIPEVEVLQIYPNYISRSIGQISYVRSLLSDVSINANANIKNPSSLLLLNDLDANIMSKAGISKSSQKIITGMLPNQIHITKASGMGDHVIWEFYRGDGIEDVGQYDLEIIFRIKHNSNKGKNNKGNENMKEELRYCIDWNLEINGKNIYDHNYGNITEKIEYGKNKVNDLEIFDPHDRFKTPAEPSSKTPYEHWNLKFKTEIKKKDIDKLKDFFKRPIGTHKKNVNHSGPCNDKEMENIKKELSSFFKEQRKIDKDNVKFPRPLVLVYENKPSDPDSSKLSKPCSFLSKPYSFHQEKCERKNPNP